MEIVRINSLIKSIREMDLSSLRIWSSETSQSAEHNSAYQDRVSVQGKTAVVKDTEKELEVLALNIQEAIQTMNYKLQFLLDAASDQVIMKVVNHKGEVIREIPPEDQLRLARNLHEIENLLFDERKE